MALKSSLRHLIPSGRRAVAGLLLLLAISASVFSIGEPAQAQTVSISFNVSPGFFLLEEGTSTTVTVTPRLTSQPTGNVTFSFSSNTGDANLSFSPNTLTRTSASLWAGDSFNVTVSADEDDGNTDDSRAKMEIGYSGGGLGSGTQQVADVHVADDDNTDTLVSNWLQRPVNSDAARIAQRFTTGSHSGGYNITSIATVLGGSSAGPGTWDPRNFEMLIRKNDNGSEPGTILATMRNPSSFSVHATDIIAGDRNVFLAPATGLWLAPNTTYWVDVGGRPNAFFPERIYGTVRRSLTLSTSEDPTNDASWSIENNAYGYRAPGGYYDDQGRFHQPSPGWRQSDYVALLEIKGSQRSARRSVSERQEDKEPEDILRRFGEGSLARSLDGDSERAVAPTNESATGSPSIGGNAHVGETLTVDVTGISDADGLANVTWRYQWLRHDGIDDSEISGETGASYTLTAADEGSAIKVRVTFTDDRGHTEVLSSGASDIVRFALIAGVAEVGETLSVDTSAISDADGMTDPQFSYQWIRSNGTVDTDISGATRSTYTLRAADENQFITVRVGYTDDADNSEELISDTTNQVVWEPDWSSKLTAGLVYNDYGYSNLSGRQSGSLTSDSIEVDGVTYTIRLIEAGSYFYIGVDQELPFDYVLEVGKSRFDSSVATHSSYSYAEVYYWFGGILFWNDGDEVDLALYLTSPSSNAEAANNAGDSSEDATGAPTISGTAQVGETLTADTSAISDADGLTSVTWQYQWLRNDSEINGATSSSYTLVNADQNQAIKVKVSFTDDAGNEEALTSTATAAVAARTNRTATGTPTISGTARVGETLAASTAGIADADGLDNVSYSYQWLRSDGEAESGITGATGSTYTLTDNDEGKTVKVKVSFTDDEANDESLTSAATGAVAPPLLTVMLESPAASHDGSSLFTFQIRFSEQFLLSFRTLKFHAFDVTAAEIRKAKRVVQGDNTHWTLTVEPQSTGDVRIVLPVTTDCEAQGAICADDGRKLSNRLDFSVSGPAQ